jgi:site-specific DNA recombinase
MTEFLAMQSGIITEYDDKLTRQLVERITVFEDKLQVDFKSGVEIEVEI